MTYFTMYYEIKNVYTIYTNICEIYINKYIFLIFLRISRFIKIL